ncbi:MAG: molybdate ABC transporter substrate-binding protein, partial [Candidatus Limnocylindrales bacterium]
SAAPGASAKASPDAALTVYAAASLTAALDRITAAYTAVAPATALTVATGSSAALETQIAQGAPADVFLSADTADPQKLVDQGLAAGAVTIFATNHLTIIVPAANPAGIQTPLDLVKPGLKIVAAGPSVPITRYATEVIANLARQPGYPADFRARYEANVVSREDDVSAVVAKVGLGEGDAGIVYLTDARTSKDVGTVAVPDAANVPATYGAVVVKASPHGTAAQAFLNWLTGPAGQAILASFGFLPPSFGFLPPS